MSIKSTPLEVFFGKRKFGRKNVHGGNIFYPFCDMGENFTPWGWGTSNLCAKTGFGSGAGSCVNFRKSLITQESNLKTRESVVYALPCFDFISTMVLYFQQQFYMR